MIRSFVWSREFWLFVHNVSRWTNFLFNLIAMFGSDRLVAIIFNNSSF